MTSTLRISDRGLRIGVALLVACLFSTNVPAQQAKGPAGLWRVQFASPLGQVAVNMTINERNGQMLKITMRGTLSGDEIRGTAQLGDVGEGALVARRTGDAG
jgi:hypothetical protein